MDLPQPDSPTTPSRLAFEDVKTDTIDCTYGALATERQTLALDRKVFQQIAHLKQRLLRSTDIARICHCLTSMADSKPSDNMLKEIDVMKMNAPGKAATQGWV